MPIIGDIEFKIMNMAGELEVYVPIIIASKAEYAQPDSTMIGSKRKVELSPFLVKGATTFWIFKILKAISDVQMTFMARVIE